MKRAFRALESDVFSAVRWAVQANARDVTALMAGRRTLVVAPHPDDETLGCGALVARICAGGHDVRVVFVSDGRGSHRSGKMSPAALAELRKQEAFAACQVLGIDPAQVRFLDLPDGQVAGLQAKLHAKLRAEMTDFGPEQILYPSSLDTHTDHRAVAETVEATLSALPAPCPAYGYPVWFWKFGLWAARPAAAACARAVKTATTGYLPIKAQALQAHRSQVENITGEPGWSVLKPSFTRHFLGAFELFFPYAP